MAAASDTRVMSVELAFVCASLLCSHVFGTDTVYYLSQFPTVRAAFDAAANGNCLIVDVDRPADATTGTLKGYWNDLTLRGTNGHRISGAVVFDGQAVKKEPVIYANSENRWVPAGTTNLLLSPVPPLSSKLVMETSAQSAQSNQCGFEFIPVVGTTGNQSVIDTDLFKPGCQGLTTAFYNPQLSCYGGRQTPHSLERGATKMPGDGWVVFFKAGDIARIENNSGGAGRHLVRRAEGLGDL